MDNHKISFKDDYSEGCHPRILEALARVNHEVISGYGEDRYSEMARAQLRQQMELPGAGVYFVSNGTQANLVMIAAMLKPFESVVAAQSAHINRHEAGAIEATGHKIDSIITEDGKLTPELIQQVLSRFEDHHTARPRLVYISNTTELGTFYNLAELEAIAAFCREKGLLLMLDGARLGAALSIPENDLTLADVARLTDAFYIGGAKNGLLVGEAIVIKSPAVQEDFLFHIKQRGALLSKGWVIGVQFLELFQDGLYLEMAGHANQMARQLGEGIRQAGYTFLTDSVSNQIFPVFPNQVVAYLEQRYAFYPWAVVDADHTAIRLVTSWATREEAVKAFIQDIRK